MAAIRIETGQESPPPTPEPMEVVFEANAVISPFGDGQWRPLSSISHHAPTTDTSEPENPEDEGKAGTSLRSKSRVSIDPDAVYTNGAAASALRVRGLAGHHDQRDPPPTRAASTVSHRVKETKHRHRLRTAPGKLERRTELHKAFSTMDDRTRVTLSGIKGNTRTSLNEFGNRICRPYSVYTVTKQCERLAISPFGGPLVNSAAGRYRERYLTKHRPDVLQDMSRESVKIKFQRFYENLDLLAINVKRIPFGTLRKPPPKQARKVENQTKSVPTQLHKYTSERVANLHESMERQDGQSGSRDDGKRLGIMSVEYKVAMEVSSNLEKHRKGRRSNLPVLPQFLAAKADAPRLQTQTERLLTPGELSLKEGISTNLYDQERSKRGPIKAIEKPPRRVKSPPLSKLSRDKFLPDAQRRRDQETWAELRIGRPATPPASEYTNVQSSSFATTARPLTAMTTHISGSENARRIKSSKLEKADCVLNQENDTFGEANKAASRTEEPETVTITPDEHGEEHAQIVGKTVENMGSNPKDPPSSEKAPEDVTAAPSENTPEMDGNIVDSKSSDEQNEETDGLVKEKGAGVPFTEECGEKQDNSSTPLSSRSLVVTIPDSDGAADAGAATNDQEDDGATSTKDGPGEEAEDGAIAEEENVLSPDQEEGEENSHSDVDEPVEQ